MWPGMRTCSHANVFHQLLSKQVAKYMVIIPVQSLSEQALEGIIDAYILREGTDYGLVETSLAQKRASVRKQLASGEAQICFYPDDEHIDIQLA